MIMKPFSKEKYLLYLLGVIFAFQAAIFGTGLFFCARNGGLSTCPKIGERYENTFNVMIATTLALLTGSAALNQRKSSVSDRALLLDEQPRQRPEQRIQETTSAPQVQDQALEEQAESPGRRPSSRVSPASPDRASRKG